MPAGPSSCAARSAPAPCATRRAAAITCALLAGGVGTSPAWGGASAWPLRLDVRASASASTPAHAEAEAPVRRSTGSARLRLDGHDLRARWSESAHWTARVRLPAGWRLVAGRLQMALGTGLLVRDASADMLASASRGSARLLSLTPSLSGWGARTGGWVLCSSERDPALTCWRWPDRQGCLVALGRHGLAVTRASGGAWCWSGMTRLGDAARRGEILLEVAGAMGDATAGVWTEARSTGGAAGGALPGRWITGLGGRWRLDLGRPLGLVEGAFRMGEGPDGSGPDGSGPVLGGDGAPRGVRIDWALPALAGLRPGLQIRHRHYARTPRRGPRSERSAALHIEAAPWSGASVQVTLAAEERIGQRADPDRPGMALATSSEDGLLDVTLRCALSQRLSCTVRSRHRSERWGLDPAAQPRHYELLYDEDGEENAPATAHQEPTWLRERAGSLLHVRIAWDPAGPARGGVGFAAVPGASQRTSFVAVRSPPGRIRWWALGVGGQMIEVWGARRLGAADVEAALRWHADDCARELTLAVGVALLIARGGR